MPRYHHQRARDRQQRAHRSRGDRRGFHWSWQLLAVVAAATALGVSPATATPTNTTANASATSTPAPDHGVPPATFRKLWSGDVDDQSAAESGSVLALVDYPFDRPPRAVEQWTHGEHGEFPTRGPVASVVPPAADPQDHRWIRDAYITVFAVQPSTVAHPEGRTTRLYVRPSGEISGVADYRVQPPENRTVNYDPPAPEPGERVLERVVHIWTRQTQELGTVEFRVEGLLFATGDADKHPRFRFGGLPAGTETLSLRVEISATINHTIRREYRFAERVCTENTGSDAPGNESCRTEYDTVETVETRYPTATTAVSDAIDVTVYRLAPQAERIRFADGGTALAIERGAGDPWASAELPSGRVHTAWHFYSARRPGWDSLALVTPRGTVRIDSDAIPLQVHAFPSTGDSYARSDERTAGTIEVTRVAGPRRQPPQLPDEITVPVVTDRYRAPATVVVRSDRAMDGRPVVHGLVRGAEATPAVTSREPQRRTDLSVAVLSANRSAGTAQVQVTLREAASGGPVDLTDRPGAVVVHGVRLEPDSDGQATATVPLGTGTVTARYQPAPWWATSPAYASSQARASVPVGWPEPLQVALAGFGLVVALLPLLFAIYVLDRLLGRRRLWPPWRGLR
jgi:hypothetical protein